MPDYAVVVEFSVRADAVNDLTRVYSGPFKEAISTQAGFRSVDLLKPTDGLSYLLIIVFSEQELQQRWVATDLHGELWSAMEAAFISYRVQSFYVL